MKKQNKKIIYECDICGEKHRTQKAIKACLLVHLEDAQETEARVYDQVASLGIKKFV